jgi:DNA-binding CsgD family transcriptional regulator
VSKQGDEQRDMSFKSLADYARLYPSIIDRMRKISRSADPFVVTRMRAILDAFDRADRATTGRLMERFGLTPSEARIALFLSEGGSIRDYAELRGVAEATVRAHLKAVFAKTGVHRQAELVRLIKD